MRTLHPLLRSAVVAFVLIALAATTQAAGAANSQPTITSTPNGNAQAGAGYGYDVAATDPDGNPLTFSLVSAPAGMTIAGTTGMVSWSPETLGTFPIVVAVDDGQGGRATQSYSIVVTPGPAASVRLDPNETTVSADETVTLTVFAADRLGNEYPVTTAILTVNDPKGTIDETQTYRPGKAGSWEVSALLGTLVAKGSVTVIPGAVAALTVNPNTNPEILTVGTTRRFAVQGFDGDDNLIENVPITWSVVGGIGDIAKDGTFTAKTAGEGKVRATYGDLIEQVAVTTKAPTQETAATPTATNANVSGQETTNAAAQPANDENADAGAVAGAEEAAAEETCTTLRWWGWLLVLLGYVIVLGVYYYLIRASRTPYWWIAPLVVTGAALWAFAAYRCPGTFGWWPWVTLIAGIIVTLFRPHKFESTLGQTIT